MCKHDITDDSEGYTDQSVGGLSRGPSPRSLHRRLAVRLRALLGSDASTLTFTEHSLPGADLNY